MFEKSRISDIAVLMGPIVAGISTAFIVFRKDPLATVANGGSFDILATGVVVAASPFLLLALKGFLVPNRWYTLFFLGAGWAALSVGLTGNFQAALNLILVVTITFYGSFVSLVRHAAKDKFIIWGPLLLLLAHQFCLTLLRGPLPEGFLGQGTGSIAFGHLMAIGVFLSYFLSNESTRFRNALFAVSAIFVIGVLLSGSRGALLGTFVGIALILHRVYLRTGLQQLLVELRRFALLSLLTAFPFFLSGALISVRPGGPAINRKLIETFQISERFGIFESPVYTAGRLEIWVTTFQEIANPIELLLGAGKSAVQTTFGSTYPHNLFLELALAGGLLALVPFALFLASVFRKMYRPEFDSSFDVFLLALVTLVFSMFSGDLAYNIVFFYFLGLAYGRITKSHSGRNV